MELEKRPLGRTKLEVTALCAGTSALGNFPEQYGYEVAYEQALETLLRIFASPIRFLDTSNNYGDGEAERRIGAALRRVGGLPRDFVIATKVDPAPGSLDFSGRRVRESVEESLERLGLDRLQLVYLHDPERISFEEAISSGGPVDALVQLRREGVVQYIGVAGGPIDLLLKFLQLDVFDAVISHNRFTLVDRSAEPLITAAYRANVAFVNAAPYGGGILAKGSRAYPRYAYQEASEGVLRRVEAIEELCARWNVPLPAVALQFSMRDPRVASTIVGISRPEHVDAALRLASQEIPNELWAVLEARLSEYC